MSELESSLEAFFRKRVRLLGGYTIKLAPTERGVPDRLLLMPGGYMFLVELKTTTGRLSPIQEVWHARIGELGVPVYTLHGQEEILLFLRRVMNHTARSPQSRRRKTPDRKVG